jgi:uroporphyrinogen decarboxylase
MKQYTGRERVEAAFKREYADRVPVNLDVAAHCARLVGITDEEFWSDPEKALKAQMKANELFPSDIVLVPGNPVRPRTYAATIERKSGPASSRKRILEDKSALATLKFRHPKENQSYVIYLKMCQRVSSMFSHLWVFASVPAPWSAAAELRGLEQLIYDTADDPQFVHQLMRRTTELAIARALAVAETGVMVRCGDPSAGCGVISPQMYREFVKPYHQQLFTTVRKETKVRLGLHMCGYTDPIMEDQVSLDLDWIDIDGPSSLKKMVEASRKKVVIRGNLDAALFGEGTKEQIEEAVKSCIEVAAPGSAYILSPGCSIPLNAPLENIGYFLDAACKYGRYG